MSSSTQALESKLEALQSHFTWDLEAPKSKRLYLRDALEDIGNDEGVFWRGHISNLLGFIQHQLGSSEEALELFNQATETFQRLNNADEGPWLLVNFGNLAWLHHLMGEDEKSQNYVSKVEDLMKKYPAPPEEPLHPEVCAEKAWTLMKFDKEKKQQAAELFQRAVQMQPDVVEWQSSWAILSAGTFKDNLKKLYADREELLRSAKERDADNLCVASLHLEARAAKGEAVQEEARVLADKLKGKPANVYGGFSPLLRLHRTLKSENNADESGDESLTQRRSAAERLTKKILNKDYRPDSSEVQEAARLWEEVIDSEPKFNLEDQITLASIYAKGDEWKADRIYQELLGKKDLDPAGKQMLHSRYARYLFFVKKNSHKSIEHHMKAAEIPEESSYRQSSITELEKTLKKRTDDPELCRMIRELLTRVRSQPQNQ